MGRGRVPTLAATLLAIATAAAAAGCGLGPGPGVGEVRLLVTRDYGARTLLERREGARESDTAMRLLERDADVSTRYGGGFVEGIDGVEASAAGPRDWFYYVDGVEAGVGAADYRLRGGDSIWWDYRDWSAAESVPAVVGAWPQPFAGAYDGSRHPVAVLCRGGGDACAAVRERLARAGAELATASSARALRVLVGPWARLRGDPAAAQLGRGPQASGVFVRVRGGGPGPRFEALDEEGRPLRELGRGAGLVAATRRYEEPPTWLVTGVNRSGVRAAANLLGPRLRGRYALACEGATAIPLPLR